MYERDEYRDIVLYILIKTELFFFFFKEGFLLFPDSLFGFHEHDGGTLVKEHSESWC